VTSKKLVEIFLIRPLILRKEPPIRQTNGRVIFKKREEISKKRPLILKIKLPTRLLISH